jgi:hypothetical protein
LDVTSCKSKFTPLKANSYAQATGLGSINTSQTSSDPSQKDVRMEERTGNRPEV